MKKLVIQYFIDLKHYPNPKKISPIKSTIDFIEKYSEISFKKYCEKYNIDFLRVSEPKIKFSHPTWERVDLWLDKSWFEKYDQICYVDTDVFAMPWAPDIFSQCDPGSFNKARYWKAERAYNEKKVTSNKQFLASNQSLERWHECSFQAGVFVLTKEARDASLEGIKDFKNPKIPDDCALMIRALAKSNAKIKTLPHEFNVKWNPCAPFPQGVAEKNLEELYFLHAFGNHKHDHPEYYLSILEEMYGKL